MSITALAAPGPFEPEPCVTQGGAPARSSNATAVLVVIIIAVWAGLVAAGVSPAVATAGLGGAAGLGLRVTSRLAGYTRSGGRDA